MSRMGPPWRGSSSSDLDREETGLGPSPAARDAVRDAARELTRTEREPRVPASLEEPEMREARRRVREHPPHLLSQTNRGLRMILIATVMVVAISWGATLGDHYITYLKIQELTQGDPNPLRVMCAINPPTERDVGLMHLCEQAAKAAPEEPAPPTPKPKPAK